MLNNDIDIEELFINDKRIDNHLIIVLNRLKEYGLNDRTHIEVTIKLENKQWLLSNCIIKLAIPFILIK